MNINKGIWNFFEVVYCLNQDSRPDRWKQAINEFDRVGLSKYHRFPSVPADQPIRSFCLSQYAMLKTFLTTGSQTLLILEDDVIFDGLGMLERSIADLPANWDMLFLGANITGGVAGIVERPPVAITSNIYRIRAAWTTHAIAYTRQAAKMISCAYDGTSMYDAWLSETMLPQLKAYLVNPMVAFQRPGKSDLWGCETDYTGAFELGNKIMTK